MAAAEGEELEKNGERGINEDDESRIYFTLIKQTLKFKRVHSARNAITYNNLI